jgi:hypothetical protein
MKSALFLSMVMLVSCAALKPKLDAQRAQGVKKVAIIGFEIHQQQPTDNFGLNALKDAVSNNGTQNSPEYQRMAKSIYSELREGIKGKTRWEVLTFDQLNQNKFYRTMVKSKMEGPRSTNLTGERMELINLHGILDVYAFRKLSAGEKASLAKELGVDAVAEFTLSQQIDQPWLSVGHITGNGSFEYQSRSNLIVYTPSSEEPVWQIQNISGESVSSKSYPEEMEKLEKVSKVGTVSAQSSIKNLVEKYSVE